MSSLKTKAYDTESSFVVALDGPSASGKGLIGRMLAKEFNLEYIQSSIVYRGLALLCINAKINVAEIETRTSEIIALSETPDLLEIIKGADLNQEFIGDYASKISTIPKVRENLNKHLLGFLRNKKRIIMEGRDIGTVLATDADLKIFITASAMQRAKRRYEQLRKEGKECMLKDILKLLEERDLRDSSRTDSPLKMASDALRINTTAMTPERIIAKIRKHIESR